MKFSTLLDMLLELLTKRKLTAAYLSEKYDLSPRTVYRYVNILAESVPLQIKRGRGGGIVLADQYKLPLHFFKSEEYDALVEALKESYSRSADERFLRVLEKIDHQEREETRALSFSTQSEDVLFREDGLHATRSTAEKLRLVSECIAKQEMLEIEYDKLLQKVEPHALVFEENGWGMYAFTHQDRAFTLFRLGRISSIVKQDEYFRKRPFELAELPTIPKTYLNVRLEIAKEGVERVQDWLGAENLRTHGGRILADAALPEDGLAEKLLSFGNTVKVISPASLKNAVAKLVTNIAKLYT